MIDFPQASQTDELNVVKSPSAAWFLEHVSNECAILLGRLTSAYLNKSPEKVVAIVEDTRGSLIVPCEEILY